MSKPIKNEWCTFCRTYFRDDPLNRRNHESSPRHQSSLRKFVDGLYRQNPSSSLSQTKNSSEARSKNKRTLEKSGSEPITNGFKPKSASPKSKLSFDDSKTISKVSRAEIEAQQHIFPVKKVEVDNGTVKEEVKHSWHDDQENTSQLNSIASRGIQTFEPVNEKNLNYNLTEKTLEIDSTSSTANDSQEPLISFENKPIFKKRKRNNKVEN